MSREQPENSFLFRVVNMMRKYNFTRAAFRKLLNNNNLRLEINKIRTWKYKNVA